MPKFDHILQNERRLRAFTGLDTATFTDFLPHFTLAMDRYLDHTTLDGYLREGDRAITYANSPLPTPADRLLFSLTYLKQNAIQEVHGQAVRHESTQCQQVGAAVVGHPGGRLGPPMRAASPHGRGVGRPIAGRNDTA